MSKIITATNAGVIVVMSPTGYRQLKKRAKYFGKLVSEGMDIREASTRASHKHPAPTMITFETDLSKPLRSANGIYGHGGYLQLYNDLVLFGEQYVDSVTDIAVPNSGGEWTLLAPKMPEDFIAIFGRSAKQILPRN